MLESGGELWLADGITENGRENEQMRVIVQTICSASRKPGR